VLNVMLLVMRHYHTVDILHECDKTNKWMDIFNIAHIPIFNSNMTVQINAQYARSHSNLASVNSQNFHKRSYQFSTKESKYTLCSFKENDHRLANRDSY